MNFKKDKYTVITEAYLAGSSAASGYMDHYTRSKVEDSHRIIENAISAGIKAAIESLVNNMYTNEDLEKDLHL